MMHTLAIAKNFETAESVAKSYCMREIAPNDLHAWIYLPLFPMSEALRLGYDWADPRGALVSLAAGRRYDRIIIANDWMGPGPYTQWRLPPGDLTRLWDRITSSGSKVVWQ